MALTDNGGMAYSMPVAPAYGGGGFGGGFGDGWWIILLLMCGWGGMGFGGGGFGGGYDFPWLLNGQNQINANTNAGFRDAMLSDGITSIGDKLASGFGTVTSQLYSNEIASLNRSFDEQSANSAGFAGIASQLAQCCCDNRLATCQTQNIVQNEGAATRLAIQNQTQAILDKMCQDKIDAKNEKIVELNNRINSLEANNYVQNALTSQTQYILSLYPPTATTTPAAR